jgi:hypothetical protein
MCSGFHLNHVEGASLGSTRIRSFGVFFTWKMGKTDRGTIGHVTTKYGKVLRNEPEQTFLKKE